MYASLHSNGLFWPKKLAPICIDIHVCLGHLHTEMPVRLTKYPIFHRGVDENKPGPAVIQPACTKMTPMHMDIFVGISQLLGYDNLIQSLTLELF